MLFVIFPTNSNFKSNASSGRISAGDYSNKFYRNAPAIVVGGEYDMDDCSIISSSPLFTKDGVNVNTLLDLYKKVNDANVWKKKTDDGTMEDISVPTGTQSVFLSAKNFGQYGDQSTWTDSQVGNAQIVVK